MLQLLLVVLLVAHCHGSRREDRVWPISNSTTVDLPQSSPFGPRFQISQSRYDFHRGVDIPAPVLTPVYAIDDGAVRIPGVEHGSFTDGVIQLVHTGWEDDGDPTRQYYSTYLHMNVSFLSSMSPGDPVSKGTQIGLSYKTSSLDHLHFEIRAGSLFQGHACNPWKYLPCQNCSPFRANTSITFDGEVGQCSATVRVSLPPDQLTFAAVQLKVVGSDFNNTIDLCEANIFYTNNPDYLPSRLDNNTLIEGVVIEPQFFNSQSFSRNEWSSIDYTFLGLPAVDGDFQSVVATVYDVFGESLSDTYYYSSLCDEVNPPSPDTTLTTDVGSTTTDVESTTTSSASSSFLSALLIFAMAAVVMANS